jgi:hypothetical protein
MKLLKYPKSKLWRNNEFKCLCVNRKSTFFYFFNTEDEWLEEIQSNQINPKKCSMYLIKSSIGIHFLLSGMKIQSNLFRFWYSIWLDIQQSTPNPKSIDFLILVKTCLVTQEDNGARQSQIHGQIRFGRFERPVAAVE